MNKSPANSGSASYICRSTSCLPRFPVAFDSGNIFPLMGESHPKRGGRGGGRKEEEIWVAPPPPPPQREAALRLSPLCSSGARCDRQTSIADWLRRIARVSGKGGKEKREREKEREKKKKGSDKKQGPAILALLLLPSHSVRLRRRPLYMEGEKRERERERWKGKKKKEKKTTRAAVVDGPMVEMHSVYWRA